jgi:pyrrolidone-carboxylate peptidase
LKPAQPPEYFEARTRYLQLADKAQRTVVMLTERLDHHRGRGQQQITVKHVTVNADQAIVGDVEHHQGVGLEPQSKDQPHAIAYAPGVTLPGTDQERQALPIASNEERAMQNARRTVTGRTEGK